MSDLFGNPKDRFSHVAADKCTGVSKTHFNPTNISFIVSIKMSLLFMSHAFLKGAIYDKSGGIWSFGP